MKAADYDDFVLAAGAGGADGARVEAGGRARAPVLAERVKRALTALKEQAAVSGSDPRIGSKPPASKEILAFVKDLEGRLAKLARVE